MLPLWKALAMVMVLSMKEKTLRVARAAKGVENPPSCPPRDREKSCRSILHLMRILPCSPACGASTPIAVSGKKRKGAASSADGGFYTPAEEADRRPVRASAQKGAPKASATSSA